MSLWYTFYLSIVSTLLVLVFFDDILVYSSSQEEHTRHVQLVLETLIKYSSVVNRKKCVYGRMEVAYLGHVISEQGIAVDTDKVKAIREWEEPRNLKELRGFLGLTRYYRKYVKHYAQIAQPLIDQLKKDSFGWTLEATTAFDQLKNALVQPPVLVMPNFKKQLYYRLMRPVAFFSKILGLGPSKNLSTKRNWWPYVWLSKSGGFICWGDILL